MKRVRIALAAILAFSAVPAFALDEPAGQLSPENWYGLLAQADSAIQAGRLVQAESMLQWLEQFVPESGKSQLALAKAEFQMSKGNVAAASAVLAVADRFVGNRCKYSKVAGWVAARNADYSKAILLVANALEQCGEDASLWNLFGLSLLGKGEIEAALEAFDSALLLAPLNPSLLNNRALALLASGRLDAAAADLQMARRLAPHDSVATDNADYLSGLTGVQPARNPEDSDSVWAHRLTKAGEGARAAARTTDAKAYFAEATLHYERFDPRMWLLGSTGQQEKAD